MAKRTTDFDRAIQQLQFQIDTLEAAKAALQDARLSKPARVQRKRKAELPAAGEAR